MRQRQLSFENKACASPYAVGVPRIFKPYSGAQLSQYYLTSYNRQHDKYKPHLRDALVLEADSVCYDFSHVRNAARCALEEHARAICQHCLDGDRFFASTSVVILQQANACLMRASQVLRTTLPASIGWDPDRAAAVTKVTLPEPGGSRAPIPFHPLLNHGSCR